MNALQIEPCYNDEPPTQPHGRPTTGYMTNRICRSIDAARRSRLRELGLSTSQRDEALKLCERGFTLHAAVLQVIAGGLAWRLP